MYEYSHALSDYLTAITVCCVISSILFFILFIRVLQATGYIHDTRKDVAKILKMMDDKQNEQTLKNLNS